MPCHKSMNFHPGDVFVSVNERIYHLRLTLGALAEMSERLPAEGPSQLAAIMRAGDIAQISLIVAACLRPAQGDITLSESLARELFTHMPPLFERAFASLSGGGRAGSDI